jgi:formylglycine-generating enzyme required for sulfatase activity
VTQRQWELIMGETGRDQPQLAEQGVSWQQAREFAGQLTLQSGAQNLYRLPTEAEWEYVCSGGQGWQEVGDEWLLAEFAWYSKRQPQTVGKLKANALGLYDMLGSQWEWTSSDYRAYADSQPHQYEQSNNTHNGQKVMRGGSYRSGAEHIGCTRRGHSKVTESLNSFGVRLVRVEK